MASYLFVHMTPECYDSEVMSLIQDLGLVQIGSEEYRRHLAALVESHYSRYWFCERYWLRVHEDQAKLTKLCSEMYKRNRKYSRYVYEALVYSPSLFSNRTK